MLDRCQRRHDLTLQQELAGEQGAVQSPARQHVNGHGAKSAARFAKTYRMSEARLENGVPVTAGWFVVNARDAQWLHNEMRSVCRFGGQGEAHFDHLGVGLYWIEPGKPMALYHHEANQEDFLILRGRCLAIVEGQERELGEWDFVHSPPGTPHTIVNVGSEPALILGMGARGQRASVHYPAEPAAIRRGAGVSEPTSSVQEAYAGFFGETKAGPAPRGL
jgi:uncharacterized cupin superfamily protein